MDIHPIFVRADSAQGLWTGYTANVQVRPLDYAVWPGGYLQDGTFVQNGLLFSGDQLYAFVWAIKTDGTERIPLQFIPINPTLYSWITFQLTQTNNIWTFRYQDATGWHTQGSFTYSGKLKNFQIITEYWAEAPIAIKTQAIQHARVRTGTTYAATPMWYSASENCGFDAITSTTPSNAVFKAQTGGACYYQLW